MWESSIMFAPFWTALVVFIGLVAAFTRFAAIYGSFLDDEDWGRYGDGDVEDEGRH